MGNRFFLAVVAMVACATLGGCTPTGDAPDSPSASPSEAGAPAELRVLCDENLVLTVSSPVVATTASGVSVLVTSEAPAGAYLHYGYGGAALPPSPSTWVLAAPPGPWELSCSSPQVEGAPVQVTVVDPGGYWSVATLESLGCPLGGMPSWAVEQGEGATAHEAIEDLIANFAAFGQGADAISRAERAEIGYRDAGQETWILGTETATQLTAVVQPGGGGFVAYPDVMCVETEWPSSSQPVD